MASIPSGLARVPNLFSSQMMLGNLTRSNVSLLQLQAQLGSGLRVLRPSDDSVSSATIQSLDAAIERRMQQLGNLQQADGLLATLDSALGEMSDLVLEAKGIGLSQIGVGSDAQTRADQAQVIDAMLQSLMGIANRDHRGIHFFGGQAVGAEPMQGMLNFFQYNGISGGMVTDTGIAGGVPVTVGAEDAIGALSARVQGAVDLDPQLTSDTRIADLRGARGLGVELGSMQIDVNGTAITVDVSSAETVGDLIQTIESAITAIDPGATVTHASGGIQIIPAAGLITISDIEGGHTAADLGLAMSFPAGAGGVGGDLDPVINELTRIDALGGLTDPLGVLRIENAGQVREVDLSGVQTVGELMNEIESLDIGVRVGIDSDGRRLNVLNELSGAHLSISEVNGGLTATALGIRSFAHSTLLSDFNDGRGVGSVSGGVDPDTGLPDPARGEDFRVRIGDGSSFNVDITGALSVSDVMKQINQAAEEAGIAVPGSFVVQFATDGNGLEFVDNTGGADGIKIDRLNNSSAAEDLGILGSTPGAVFAGSDNAKVAADGLFTHLVALRDALLANDEAGIAFATEQLDEDVLRVAETRASVGVRSRRITDGLARQENLMVQDQSLRSTVRDLDYAEAATRYALLEQQLTASMMTISRSQQLSLLDFLR